VAVDRVAERLAKAKDIGAIPIDFTEGEPAGQIKVQTRGAPTGASTPSVTRPGRTAARARSRPRC
jgi:glutathione-independent formaldehyde dehydrogenase